MLVAPRVTHHADRVHRQVDREGLADLVVEIVLSQFVNEDRVRAPQHVGIAFPDLAEDANAEPRPRKRMAVNHLGRQPELHADSADLVLEQFPQRLDELEVHALRQAADVVVRLDDVRLLGRRAGRLDDVRVDRSLGEPPDVLEARRLLFKNFDEQAADALSFLLRIFHAFQRREKTILGVHPLDVDAQVPCERRHDLIAFVLPQQSVIDKNADQLIADGLVQQRRDHRRIHATGKRQQHVAVFNPAPHVGDAVLDDPGRRPEFPAAADLVNEAREDAHALAGVGDFGMKLDAIVAARLVHHAGDGRVVGGRHELEPGRQAHHAVAVTHPHVQQAVSVLVGVVFDVFEQPRVPARADLRVAELPVARGFHVTAELRCHGLHAVTDAEQRHARLEHRVRRANFLRVLHGLRTAGEDDAPRRERGQLRGIDVEGTDLAVHPCLAHAAGDELRVLGTEIEDQDPIRVDVRGRLACGEGRRCRGRVHGLRSVARAAVSASGAGAAPGQGRTIPSGTDAGSHSAR